MASSKNSPSDLGEVSKQLSLESVRDSLIRQEDSIIFSLIERSRYPYNAPAYDSLSLKSSTGSSLAELFVKEAEALHAKAGRYLNPEEVPFLSDDLPSPLLSPYNYPQVLHPPAASVNINKKIWNMYFNELLPLFTSKGDDGNYALAMASDLVCLQNSVHRPYQEGSTMADLLQR
ncbi:Chorismate mutase 2 [Apostasia shenzhenica]|uniref:chorismate mutase n=1 Tax=Apostasia shenzhenica TaxID=1088818 RepID=A0A2I0A5M9_9ASPA|nr:Chorismate mutase 2 [Apostasia shenzhenica]